MVTSQPRSRGFSRHVPPQYFWPVLTLLLLCFSGVFLLLFFSTRTQDEMQIQRERQALTSLVRTATDMVQHDLQDYAKWDDAVRHTDGSVDREWVADNVVAYLGQTQGYSYVFVLDEADRTAYSFGKGARRFPGAQARLGRDFANSIVEVRRMPRDAGPIVSGFSRAGDAIFIYSTAAVVPLTGKVQLKPGPTKLLVIARKIDDSFLATITRELRLQDIHLSLARPSGTAVPLMGFDDRPVAWVQWTPHRPGTILLGQLAPALAALALFAIFVAAMIVRHGSRTIEALQQSELRARHHAFHDLLTGLPNRRALVDEISEQLSRSAPLALLCMDLDGFKDANDVYGHPAGDLLLREAASRIQSAASDALVARAGGDEFAVLILHPTSDQIDAICHAILQSFRAPFEIGSYRVTLGISIGCAEASTLHPEGQDELMRQADIAMYAAKSEGRNRACHYAPSLDDGHMLRMRLEHDLIESVANGEIYVRYQPIVDAGTSSVVAFEALARWSHPQHGDVPPDVFIPIAEMNGLISVIGRHVLHQACSTMLNLDGDLAVNLSPAQFWDRNLVADIQEILDKTGFPPSRLELEITENLLIRRPEKAAEIIERLRSLGIKIALDDFGTGFASIGYLQRLKLDRIKIDKAFVAPLENDQKAREMLFSIVTLARAFDVEVCAEGVETEGQAEISAVAGCCRLQGWLFGRPMNLADLRARASFRDKTLSAVA